MGRCEVSTPLLFPLKSPSPGTRLLTWQPQDPRRGCREGVVPNSPALDTLASSSAGRWGVPRGPGSDAGSDPAGRGSPEPLHFQWGHWSPQCCTVGHSQQAWSTRGLLVQGPLESGRKLWAPWENSQAGWENVWTGFPDMHWVRGYRTLPALGRSLLQWQGTSLLQGYLFLLPKSYLLDSSLLMKTGLECLARDGGDFVISATVSSLSVPLISLWNFKVLPKSSSLEHLKML